MSFSKEQLDFFLNSVKNKLHKDRSSFTFPITTMKQLDTALNAMYKSGYVWLYKVTDKETMREELRKALSHFGNIRIRLRYDWSCGSNIKILYHPFYNHDIITSDLEFKEAMEFLIELRKGYKEIEGSDK